jgi:hypothetical protein
MISAVPTGNARMVPQLYHNRLLPIITKSSFTYHSKLWRRMNSCHEGNQGPEKRVDKGLCRWMNETNQNRYHWQNSPFWILTFLDDSARLHPIFSSSDSARVFFFFYRTKSSALRSTTNLGDWSLYSCPPVTGWPSYIPRHWVLFSTTRWTSWVLAAFSVSWSYTQSVRRLGRRISPPQGLYLHIGQHKIKAHMHPCLEWDSNI